MYHILMHTNVSYTFVGYQFLLPMSIESFLNNYLVSRWGALVLTSYA